MISYNPNKRCAVNIEMSCSWCSVNDTLKFELKLALASARSNLGCVTDKGTCVPLHFENHRNWLAIHSVMYYRLTRHSIHTYTIICMCVASLFNIESVDAHNLDYESIIFFKPRYIYLDGLKPRLHEIL